MEEKLPEVFNSFIQQLPLKQTPEKLFPQPVVESPESSDIELEIEPPKEDQNKPEI